MVWTHTILPGVPPGWSPNAPSPGLCVILDPVRSSSLVAPLHGTILGRSWSFLYLPRLDRHQHEVIVLPASRRTPCHEGWYSGTTGLYLLVRTSHASSLVPNRGNTSRMCLALSRGAPAKPFGFLTPPKRSEKKSNSQLSLSPECPHLLRLILNLHGSHSGTIFPDYLVYSDFLFLLDGIAGT
jgi:hypothetical protein